MSRQFTEDVRADLESKIAYLERANNELSDAVYRQQRDLQALQLQLNTLLQRLDAMGGDERARSPEEERPPHY